MREMSQPSKQLNQQQSFSWRESTVKLPTRANQQPVSPPVCHLTHECKSHLPQYGYDGMQGSGYHTQVEWNIYCKLCRKFLMDCQLPSTKLCCQILIL
jgi:hypothetical protein